MSARTVAGIGIALIIMCIAALAIAGPSFGNGEENIPPGTEAPAVNGYPQSFEEVSLAISGNPALNRPVELTATVTQFEFMEGDVSVKVDLPEGFELVSGDLAWDGFLAKGGSVGLTSTIKAVETGNWTITVRTQPIQADVIYVVVGEGSGQVFESYDPDFYANPEDVTLQSENYGVGDEGLPAYPELMLKKFSSFPAEDETATFDGDGQDLIIPDGDTTVSADASFGPILVEVCDEDGETLPAELYYPLNDSFIKTGISGIIEGVPAPLIPDTSDSGIGASGTSYPVFSENFEAGFPGDNWHVGDWNESSGYDYWDDSSYRAHGGYRSGWCAGIGSHSYYGGANAAYHRYDNNMDGYFAKKYVVDMSTWDIGYIDFWAFLVTETGFDKLRPIWYGSDGYWWYGESYLDGSHATWNHYYWPIPEDFLISRGGVGFVFYSDYSNFAEGAYVDDLYLVRSDITLDNYYISPPSVLAGNTITVNYLVNNPSPFNLNTGLGAKIRDPYGTIIEDPVTTVTVTPGSHWFSRTFTVPAGASSGSYDVEYSLWSGNVETRCWDVKTQNDVLMVTPSSTTLHYKVKGHFTYTHPDTGTQPVQDAYVKLYDSEPYPADAILLETTLTDENGYFEFAEIDNNDGAGEGGRDIIVMVVSSNDQFFVSDGIDDGSGHIYSYYSTSPMFDDVGSGDIIGGYLDVGSTNVEDDAAYFLMETGMDEYYWFMDRIGWSRPWIKILWPYSDWPGYIHYYNVYTGEITKEYIEFADGWEWEANTLLHEYGHAVMMAAYGSNHNNWPHSAYDGQDHWPTLETDGALAIKEGWAEFIECAIYNEATYSFGSYETIESNDFADYIMFGNWDGNKVEGAVASILWDIYDGADPNDDCEDGHYDDGITLGDGVADQFGRIWTIMTTYRPQDMEEFWTAWNSHYGYSVDLDRVYLEHRIRKDVTAPETIIQSGPSGETGASPVFIWTGTDGVTPADGLSFSYMLEGYDTGWTAYARCTTAQYTGLPLGDYTFRVKAKDQAENEDATPATRAFDVDPGVLTVTLLSPNGGENWTVGTSHAVTWNAEDDVGVTAIDLLYSTNGGVSWVAIATGETDDGTYTWLVPNTPSETCRVKVIAYNGAGHTAEDVSDAVFTIYKSNSTDPSERILGLIDYINGMQTYTTIKSRLIYPLNAALTSLNSGNDAAAVTQLTTFINTVRLYDGRYITHTDALYLIGEAEDIIAEIGSSPSASFTFTPADPDAGEMVTFDASGSSDDGAIVAYTWTFGDGAGGSGVTATHTYAAADTYSVTLTVIDNDGRTDSMTKSVTVSPEVDVDPVTRIQELITYINNQGYYSTIRDKMVTILNKVIGDLNAGNDDRALYGLDYFIGYIEVIDGRYIPHTDALYLIAEAEAIKASIESGGGNPVPSFTVSDSTPEIGQTVTFDASGSSDDGVIIAYGWTFGDGSSGSGKIVTHTYLLAGTYTVTLTVTDNDGNSASTSTVITVGPGGGSSALERISDLMSYINSNSIHPTAKAKMLDILNKVTADLNAGNDPRAMYGLNYLISYVQSVDGTLIPHANAVYIKGEAQAIILLIQTS